MEKRALQPGPAALAGRSERGRLSGGILRRATGSGCVRRSTSGFTLIELLVVIGVLTVLIAFLVPVFFLARNKSHDSVCISNLRQAGQALDLYTNDWDGFLPYAPGSPIASGLDPIDLPNYAGLRSPQRPSQSTYISFLLLSDHRGLTPEMFRCPNDTGEDAFNYYSRQGSVFDSASTSYLWDPASDAARTFAKTADGEVSEPVNGEYVDGLRNPSRARLLQDYGSSWHTKIQTYSTQEGGQDYRVNQGFVNAVFADSHVAKVATDNYERVVLAPQEGPSGPPTDAPDPDASPTH